MYFINMFLRITGSSMNTILSLKKSNCKNCYKCIRNCPVKSIKFSEQQANIITDECILCGKCFVACPQNAKQIRDDTQIVLNMIKAGKKVIASVAPSFISEFCVSGIEQMREMLMRVGFYDAYETAEGAQLVKKEYEKLISAKSQPVIISSCCHSVNTLIQKYYPSAVPFLADVITPMQAHARMLKKQVPDCCVVFIGPCISKKAEEMSVSEVDCVLTFEDIALLFEREGIEIKSNSVSAEQAYRSRFFPRAGGIIASMDTCDSGFDYFAVDGVENCMSVLDSLKGGTYNNCFIEMNACEGGCINGPATNNYRRNRIESIKRVNENSSPEDKQIDCSIPMDKSITFCGTHRQKPGNEAIKDILRKMGKTLPEHELNCGSCGYNTCREKAVAVYYGKADLTMCLPYLKEKAESFSDQIINNSPNAIIALDEELNIIEINDSACKLFKITDRQSMIKNSIVSLMNPTDIMTVINSGKSLFEKKARLDSYGKTVEESIIFDADFNICVIFMKDISDKQDEEDKKNELCMNTVEIADKVIEKQMRVVQEIASLLGETAAETQIALTKLKDTFITNN